MLRFALVLIAFVVLTAVLAGVLFVLKALRLPGRGAVSILYSRTLCALLGVRIQVSGTPPGHHSALILANHVSWIDILAITATVPAIFVAKREVAGWPLVGWVARTRGTVFVDRQRRRQTADANRAIAGFLAQGQSIVLFAEGTSSDGNRVLPFRSALVGALDQALGKAGSGRQLAVQPLSVAYTRLQGLPMGRQHRPIAAWYGDSDLLPHLRQLLRRGPVDVALTWGAPVEVESFADRKALVCACEAAVRELTAAVLRGRPAERAAPTQHIASKIPEPLGASRSQIA